jgi:diguanylate cyclase (GGDEF)-like protein
MKDKKNSNQTTAKDDAQADDRARVQDLNTLAEELKNTDPARTQVLATQAQALAVALGDLAGQARSRRLQGYAAYRLGERGQALEQIQEALELSRKAADTAVEADCLHDLGRLYNILAEYEISLEHHRQALDLYQQRGDRAGEAQALNDIGNAHFGTDDFGQALSYYLDSLRLREALNDEEGVGCSLNNIGNVYSDLKDHQQALIHYERCLEVSRRIGADRLEVRCLGNIAETYQDMRLLGQALETSRAAHALAKQRGYRSDECYALKTWGNTHKAAGRLDSALPLLDEALLIARQLLDRSAECEILVSLGETHLALGALREARIAFFQAEKAAEALHLKRILFQALRGLSQLCKTEGDFPQALAYYERFYALEREVFSEESEKRARALMLNREVDLAQREAELHRGQNVELARMNEALRHADTEREQLLKELRAQAEELEKQAGIDALTGLANRRHLESWLARQFAHAHRYGGSLTVALADVDHFKQVNDRFGHQIGDQVLKTVADLMQSACRTSDIAARYGGEEFVLALPETDLSQGRTVCERLRRMVEEYPWDLIQDGLGVTISIGLSDDPAAASYERLLSQADARLYAAKHAGRNCVIAE